MSPWMEFAAWSFISTREKTNYPASRKGKALAKGIITTPLLAKIGKFYADEPIPDVGLYIPPVWLLLIRVALKLLRFFNLFKLVFPLRFDLNYFK